MRSLSDPRTPPPDEPAALLVLSQGPCQHLLQMASNPAVLRRPMTSEFIPLFFFFSNKRQIALTDRLSFLGGNNCSPHGYRQAGEAGEAEA